MAEKVLPLGFNSKFQRIFLGVGKEPYPHLEPYNHSSFIRIAA
jgi:hypothetical protein